MVHITNFVGIFITSYQYFYHFQLNYGFNYGFYHHDYVPKVLELAVLHQQEKSKVLVNKEA